MAYKISFVFVCKAAVKDDCNAVLNAFGKGPDPITVHLFDSPTNQVWAEPAAWAMGGDNYSLEDVAQLQGLQQGDLPLIAGQWGEEGVISAAAAQAAFGGGNTVVSVESGDSEEISASVHFASVLATHGYHLWVEAP